MIQQKLEELTTLLQQHQQLEEKMHQLIIAAQMSYPFGIRIGDEIATFKGKGQIEFKPMIGLTEKIK